MTSNDIRTVTLRMNDQDVRQKVEKLKKRLESAQRIKEDLEKKAASLRKQESRRKCLTYDDLKGFWLGYPDSNQERQDQNLQCYHYTIPQTLNLHIANFQFRNAGAKVRTSDITSKDFGDFF